jgi:hypothetical protein
VTSLTPETAIAIIASHGADPALWPADVAPALLALAESDAPVAAAVAAALADARALDADLAGWLAARPALAGVDVAAITAAAQLPTEQPAPAARRAAGWRPALLAASLTMMLATAGWFAMPGAPGSVSPNPSARSPSAVAEVDETALVFAQVFTPTAAEEDLI